MGIASIPHKALLFIGILYRDELLLEKVSDELVKRYGPIFEKVDNIPFDVTTYYDKEMGEGIKKAFLFFDNLISMDKIVEIKLETNDIEEKYIDNAGNRRINLDPGYLDMAKVVLATTKDRGHRVYLRDGIFAESTLKFYHGTYTIFPWTYPDFKKDEYIALFNRIREIYSQKRFNE